MSDIVSSSALYRSTILSNFRRIVLTVFICPPSPPLGMYNNSSTYEYHIHPRVFVYDLPNEEDNPTYRLRISVLLHRAFDTHLLCKLAIDIHRGAYGLGLRFEQGINCVSKACRECGW